MGLEKETWPITPLFNVPLDICCQVVLVSFVFFFTYQLKGNDVFFRGKDLAPFVFVIEVLDVGSAEEF